MGALGFVAKAAFIPKSFGKYGPYRADAIDEEASLDESLKYNAARSSMIVPSEDLLEAVSAYMQKRKGKFKGA